MKLFIGIIIGALLASGIFYYVTKINDDKRNSFIASIESAESTSMNMIEPKDESSGATIIVSNPLNILISSSDELYYYNGKDCNKLGKVTLPELKSKIATKKKNTSPNDLMIIIKSTQGSSFKSVIDVLDQITLVGIQPGHYAEVEISENEKACLKNFQQK